MKLAIRKDNQAKHTLPLSKAAEAHRLISTGQLTRHGIAISMDGVGRAFDNIMVERLWRTVKYDDVYIRDYKSPVEARFGLQRYFEYYKSAQATSLIGPQDSGGCVWPCKRNWF